LLNVDLGQDGLTNTIDITCFLRIKGNKKDKEEA